MQRVVDDGTFGSIEPIFNYTSIPLDSTQCIPFPDICSAMQAITDYLNKDVRRVYSNETCSLEDDCLTITCVDFGRSTPITTTITLSPCDYAVTVKVSTSSFTRYIKKFKESGIDFYPIGYRRTLLQVTLVKLQAGAAIGLQVRILEWRFLLVSYITGCVYVLGVRFESTCL